MHITEVIFPDEQHPESITVHLTREELEELLRLHGSKDLEGKK